MKVNLGHNHQITQGLAYALSRINIKKDVNPGFTHCFYQIKSRGATQSSSNEHYDPITTMKCVYACMLCINSTLLSCILRYAKRRRFYKKKATKMSNHYKPHHASSDSVKSLKSTLSYCSLFAGSTVLEPEVIPSSILVKQEEAVTSTLNSRRLKINGYASSVDLFNFPKDYGQVESKDCLSLELPVFTNRSLHFDGKLWATIFGKISAPAIVNEIVFNWSYGAITYTDTVANTPVRRSLGKKFTNLFKSLRGTFNEVIGDAGNYSSIVHQINKGQLIDEETSVKLQSLSDHYGSLHDLLNEVKEREQDLLIIARAVKHLTTRKQELIPSKKQKVRSGKAALALKQDIEEGKTFFSESRNLKDVNSYPSDEEY